MSYIEGMVAAVPAANKDAFCRHAASAALLFREYGVTRQVESWGDDVPEGKITDFKEAVKARPDEVIVFSWLEYPDKATRDSANERMTNDPRMKEMGEAMPFDGKRMIFGGFSSINDSGESSKPGYVEGCLVPVPERNKDAYRKMSAMHGAVLQEYGATRVVDAWGDDLPDGKVTDFKNAVKAKDGEKIVYSWVEWPSKQTRDEGWEKAKDDPRMKDISLPFDGKRVVYGGFAPVLDE
jgi:uncharacterized protein YbaA (DUF1428 family)